MGAAELVGRAEEDVAAELGDVDRLVGCVVDGVDPRERPGLAGERADPARVGDAAGGVRGEREGDDPGAVRELALEVVVVDRELVGRRGDEQLEAAVGGELDPGRDAAVVVELGRQDLAAGRRGRGRRRG